jgi:SAM-dependent methyltransferase
MDPRDEYIGRVVKGKSFADIGGLWGTTEEKVTIAHKFGATSLAMVDIQPPNNELWKAFKERCNSLGVVKVECIVQDIQKWAETDPPQYDVVHCSGVIYHIPNPIRALAALRKMTREFLILTSAVISTHVASDEGILVIPESAILFIPALRERELDIVKSYWERFVGEGALGLTRPLDEWKDWNYGAWWWLFTVNSLKSMCRVSGFDFVDGSYTWNNNAYTQLLRVRSSDNSTTL